MKTRLVIGKSFAETVFFWSLMLLLLILPFDEGGNGYILQFITQLLLLLCATVWALQTLRRGKVDLIFDRIDLLVLGVIGWSIVSLYISVYKYATMLELIKVLSYVALFYLCRMLFPLERKRTLLLAAILCSVILQLMISVYSYCVRHTPFLQAGFLNPVDLSCFFVLGVIIALSFVLFSPRQKNSRLVREMQKESLSPSPESFRLWSKLGAGLLIVAFVVALLSLRSRGAIISLVCTGFLLTTLRKKMVGLIFLVLFCIVLLLPTPWGNTLQRLSKRDDPYAYERINIWTSSLKMIADHPVFGVGLGMYDHYARVYNFPLQHQVARYAKVLHAAHSDSLQIGAELGIVGFVLFLATIVIIGYYSWTQLKNKPVAWQTVAASTGILSVLIQGLFSNLLLSPALAMTVVILAVILIDNAGSYYRKTITFVPSWQWYGALLVAFVYVLIPVIWYPFWGHVHYLKYYDLRQQKLIPEAVKTLKKALRYVPIHAYYHHTFGKLYLTAFRNHPNLDAFYEGYKELTAAIRYNPREFEFYVNLAELHREMFYRKLYTNPTAQNALREYRRALQYNPFNPFILFAIATLHADLGEFDQAITALQEAVSIEPNFVGGHQMLGKLFTHLQRPQEAERAFQQAETILRQHHTADQGSDYTTNLLQSIE